MQDAVTTLDLAGAPERPAGAGGERWRLIARNALPFIVVGGIWEIVAHAGLSPPKLFPPLKTVAATFVRLTVSGVLPHHTMDTLLRLAAGFAIAAISGVGVGLADGTLAAAGRGIYLLPLVSILAPIPGLAYAPLFPALVRARQFSAVLWSGSFRRFRSSSTPGPA